jgi:hypothetical protein
MRRGEKRRAGDSLLLIFHRKSDASKIEKTRKEKRRMARDGGRLNVPRMIEDL